MKNYLIIIEKAEENYSAYSPDVEGCVAVGNSIEETVKNMKEALEFHIKGLIEDGLPVPECSTQSHYIQIEAA